MKERPILFSGPMVSAILKGWKTQTRRIMKPQPTTKVRSGKFPWDIGDRLWVRETFAQTPNGLVYAADDPLRMTQCRWTPSIHMPHWASRVSLEVTDVRVERLQEISEADILAEGVRYNDGIHGKVILRPTWWFDGTCFLTSRGAFEGIWEQVNGFKSWDKNPWVWVVSFRPIFWHHRPESPA